MTNYGDMDVCDNDPETTKKIRGFYRGNSLEAHLQPEAVKTLKNFNDILRRANEIIDIDSDDLEGLSKEEILSKLNQLKKIGYSISGYNSSTSFYELVTFYRSVQSGIRHQLLYLTNS